MSIVSEAIIAEKKAQKNSNHEEEDLQKLEKDLQEERQSTKNIHEDIVKIKELQRQLYGIDVKNINEWKSYDKQDQRQLEMVKESFKKEAMNTNRVYKHLRELVVDQGKEIVDEIREVCAIYRSYRQALLELIVDRRGATPTVYSDGMYYLKQQRLKKGEDFSAENNQHHSHLKEIHDMQDTTILLKHIEHKNKQILFDDKQRLIEKIRKNTKKHLELIKKEELYNRILQETTQEEEKKKSRKYLEKLLKKEADLESKRMKIIKAHARSVSNNEEALQETMRKEHLNEASRKLEKLQYKAEEISKNNKVLIDNLDKEPDIHEFIEAFDIQQRQKNELHTKAQSIITYHKHVEAIISELKQRRKSEQDEMSIIAAATEALNHYGELYENILEVTAKRIELARNTYSIASALIRKLFENQNTLVGATTQALAELEEVYKKKFEVSDSQENKEAYSHFIRMHHDEREELRSIQESMIFIAQKDRTRLEKERKQREKILERRLKELR